MPEFSSFFSASQPQKKLSHKEVLLALRFSIASEYEAIQIYEQIIDATDNAVVKMVMNDIVNEEKEHVGEFERLIEELYPEEDNPKSKGVLEVENMIREE